MFCLDRPHPVDLRVPNQGAFSQPKPSPKVPVPGRTSDNPRLAHQQSIGTNRLPRYWTYIITKTRETFSIHFELLVYSLHDGLRLDPGAI